MKNYLQAFNKLVEIRTSAAIFSSVIFGSMYGFYVSGTLHFLYFIAMLIAGVALDMAATAFNNIYDYYKALDKEGYLYTIHNPIVYYHLRPVYAILIALGCLGVAGIAGLYLVLSTSIVLLYAGIAAAMVAVIYSAGKIPISYFPISEFVSGFFEGTVVIMVSAFLQTGRFTFDAFWVSVPVLFSIGNIMLANNITDIAEDKINHRLTLPIIIGRVKAFGLLITISILTVILSIIYYFTGLFPVTAFITVLLLPVYYRHLRFFIRKTTKKEGFVKILSDSLLYNFTMIFAFLLYFLFLR